jgi:DNA-binding CsgD family transcriptional regulator/PAS domain-containing protein
MTPGDTGQRPRLTTVRRASRIVRKRTAHIDEVLARVYEAALDPSAWQTAIEHAAELIGAHSAMLFVADWSSDSYAPAVLAGHRIDPNLLSTWQSSYLPHDLWSHRMRDLSPNFVTTGAFVVEPRELRRSPLYVDVLRKAGMEDALSAVLARENGLEFPLSFYARELFQPSQVKLLERMTPHLRIAMRLQIQMGALRHRAAAMEQIVDGLSVGVLTLARNGRVLWANQRAKDVLDARDGLILSHGRACCTRSDETALLDAAIGAAAAADVGAMMAQALSVSRRSGRRPLSVIVAPLPAGSEHHAIPGMRAPRRAAVVVTVNDPERRVELAPERLRRILGLTRAEAKLAAALATERTLAEYAEQAGITMNTARWTLKRVLEKTRCRRQSQLVRLVLTSAGEVLG